MLNLVLLGNIVSLLMANPGLGAPSVASLTPLAEQSVLAENEIPTGTIITITWTPRKNPREEAVTAALAMQSQMSAHI
jgi:hypothetical protein